jgi:aminoglycoside phosphotransferase (APT) family kinase protein
MGHGTSTVACGRVDATLDHAQAALAAARGAGLAVERAEVVRVASNVLVRLEPEPVAARLSGATAPFRDSAANLRREARLAAALAGAGAPVPAPIGGPYEAGGCMVTLWPWLELDGEAGDAADAGRALRACHDALGDLDAADFDLVPLAMLTEARRLAAAALPEVLPAVERALATLGATPQRIVHGDSHPGNVLWTADGPLWSDWEDAHLAPLEWDLGCLLAASRRRGDDFGWAQAALAAHGAPYDAQLLDACVDARVAQGAAYLAATGRGDVSGHLAWLGVRAS